MAVKVGIDPGAVSPCIVFLDSKYRMTTALFERNIPSNCQYSNLRDNAKYLAIKCWLESLWARYEPLCGDSESFIRNFGDDYVGLSWEMFMACHLLDSGKILERPLPMGPDIKLRTSSGVIWVEATAPRPGIGPDGAIPPAGDSYYWIDEDRMMLRYANALAAKLIQWKESRSRGDVEKGDPYVIALCDGSIPDGGANNICPPIVRSVYGIGKLHYSFPWDQHQSSIQDTDIFLPTRDSIQKRSGNFVDIDIFRKPEYAAISGILYSPLLPWDAYQRSLKFFLYIENPAADNPIPRDTFSVTRSYWMESDSVCFS